MNKVLVADDDIDILIAVNMILNHHDFEVKSVPHWQKIHEAISNFSPDLILLDIDLSGADGRLICKELKQSKDFKNIPILLFSAHADLPGNLKVCGADGSVAKPFEINYLVDTIRKNIA